METKYYLALAVGTAAAMLMAAGPLAAHDCAENETQAAAERPTVFADQNRDGKVTREAARVDQALERSFGRYDQNDDDALDRAEFARLEADSSGPRTTWLGRLARLGQPDEEPAVELVMREDLASHDDRLRPRHTVHQTPP